MSAQATIYKMRLKKGDTVAVRSGKYKGRSGKILAIHPKINKVTVEGINVVKRHLKPTRIRPQGGIVEITKPLWASKVGIADGKKASKVAYNIDKSGKKTRILKSTGKEIK